MEVVNTDTFEPTEHLIGQQNPTLSFGVSSDPALMAMLSTGLYTYPHRTMIQELLFNAWDAHKMIGATDTPIDVYINSTSGLIVRDYGPGIEPGEGDANIHGTYCIYGYSSKRKDKNMTGGFGLGTKAPFAYTESFSVTSFWGGTKNMYLIRRVAEDQGGRPGLTPLMKVPSTETGLMVVIPLKTGHEHKTRSEVRDLCYLSGMKVNIHFEDEPVEEIRSYSIFPGEYLFADSKEMEKNKAVISHKNRVFAVYGGVRYVIPRDEVYDPELNFIQNVIRDDQQVFIGFAPDSLTPTPNRENLNLNEKTKEAIRQSLEVFYERFQEIVEPLAKVYIQIAITKIQSETKNPLYGLYRAMLIGHDQEKLDMDTLLEGTKIFAPDNAIDQSIWLLGLRLMNKYIDTYVRQLKTVNWFAEISKAYATLYPDGISLLTRLRMHNKTWRAAISKMPNRGPFERSTVNSIFQEMFNHETLTKLQKTISDWNNAGNFPISLRGRTNEGWKVVRFERPFHRIGNHWHQNTYKNKHGTRAHRPGDGSSWFYPCSHSDKGLFKKHKDTFYAPDIVIISKTAKVLVDMPVHELTETVQAGIFGKETDIHWSDYHQLVNPSSFMTITVRSLHGDYDRAKEFFESRGYTVWEAPEPIASLKKASGPKAKKPNGYRVLQSRQGSWVVPSSYVPKEDEVIQDPEYYLYRTLHDMGEYSLKANPSEALVSEWLQAHPKTVVVNNITQAAKLKNAGVKNMEEHFSGYFETWITNPTRFRLLVLLEYLETAFRLPLDMLDSPAMRKEFNIPIPASAKIADYRKDIERMQILKNTNYPPLAKLAQKIKINSAFMAPDVPFIQQKNNQFMIFDLPRLGQKFQAIPPGEQEAFIKKVIKMSKSF